MNIDFAVQHTICKHDFQGKTLIKHINQNTFGQSKC